AGAVVPDAGVVGAGALGGRDVRAIRGLAPRAGREALTSARTRSHILRALSGLGGFPKRSVKPASAKSAARTTQSAFLFCSRWANASWFSRIQLARSERD